MSRPATPLNLAHPPEIGCAYIIRNVKTKKLVRCSTACQRDVDNGLVRHIRALSGDEPFFNVKIGSAYKGFHVLKFLCGEQHTKCLDMKKEWEWLGITLEQAREEGLKFIEPNYLYPERRALMQKIQKNEELIKKRRGPYRTKRSLNLVKELSMSQAASPEVSASEPIELRLDDTEVIKPQ